MKKLKGIQRRRPRQARAQFTRDSIVEAASQILRRFGANALNTNSIAERAGVSIGTLYQYFPDKDAILVAVARRELDHGESALVVLHKALLEALIRAIESLLGRAVAQGRTMRRTRAKAMGSESLVRKMLQVEAFLLAWIAPPMPARLPVRRSPRR